MYTHVNDFVHHRDMYFFLFVSWKLNYLTKIDFKLIYHGDIGFLYFKFFFKKKFHFTVHLHWGYSRRKDETSLKHSPYINVFQLIFKNSIKWEHEIKHHSSHIAPVFCGYKLRIEQKWELSENAMYQKINHREYMEIMATGQITYFKMA